MEKQKDKIVEVLTNIEVQRSSTDNLKNSSGVSMIVLAVMGLIVLAAVNLVFYILAKKGLKDRKLI